MIGFNEGVCRSGLAAIVPGGWIVEEVPGFQKYLVPFCQKMATVGPGYAVHAMMVDATLWVKWPRTRTGLLTWHCSWLIPI